MHTEGDTDWKCGTTAGARAPRRWSLLIVVLGAGIAAGVTATRAAEPIGSCAGFCGPVSATQLESTRGAGSDTQVGVILWDELRRQATPPPPPPSNAGDDSVSVHGPGSIVLAVGRSR